MMTAVAVVLFPLFAIGVLGGGDVKLCMIIPLYMSAHDSVSCIVISFAAAAAAGAVKLVKNRIFRERIRYFCSYAVSVCRTGRLNVYSQEIEDKEYRKAFSAYKIHFAVSVFASVVIKAMGAY